MLTTRLAALLLALPSAAQSNITATLIALDSAYARVTNGPLVVTEQIQPAGVLTSMNLHANVGNCDAQYVCTLTGARLQASTSYLPQAPLIPHVHADLLLVLAGPPGVTCSLDLTLTHGGDMADAGGFSVDLGADGTVEVDTGWRTCNCGSPIHHRAWDWTGFMLVRIRTDTGGGAGAQGYSLDLQAREWAPGAHSVSPGSSTIAAATDVHGFYGETSNYHLSAMPGSLQAVGLGALNLFLVSTQPLTVNVQLPPPYGTSGTVLASAVSLTGTVSATTSNSGVPVLPRAWTTVVPVLPPGLTFYLQHLSLTLAAPYWAGTTNVVRLDT